MGSNPGWCLKFFRVSQPVGRGFDLLLRHTFFAIRVSRKISRCLPGVLFEFKLFLLFISESGCDSLSNIYFIFFRHCETFFRKKISPKGPPTFFLMFCDRMDVENPKGSPLSVFFGIVRFFPENENFCVLQFFHVLRQNGC